MSSFTRTVYQSSGQSRLFTVLLVVGAAWAKSTSDYWTVVLRRVTTGETYGRTVATYSLDARDLVAGTPVTVYSSDVGLAMADGERLRAYVSSTGSPAALTDAVLFAEIQRNARRS